MALDPRIALMGRSVEVPDVVDRRARRAQAVALEQEAAEREREAAAQERAAQIFAQRGVIDDEAAAALMSSGAFKTGIDAYKAVGGRRVDEAQAGANQALGQFRGEQSLTEQQKRARADSLLPGELALQTENITKAQQETGVAEPSPKMRLDQQKIQAEIASGFPAFAEAYIQANPKAKPMDVQYAYARRAQAPVAGRDVPLPQAVLDQQLQIKRTGAPRTSVTVNGEQRTFQNEQDLRKEFSGLPTVKAYTEVKRQAAQARNAYNSWKSKGGSANSVDQVLVTSLNKVLDPDSVVRESEYARTAEGQSALNQLQGWLGKLSQGGGGLSATEREAVVRTIEQLNATMEQQYQPVSEQYRGLASQYGLNADRVTKPFTSVESDFNAKREPAKSPAIVQRNKTTGAYRHSTDGGKTWKAGQP